MNNTRFATIIHILTLLTKMDGQKVSSDWIAGSININPVIVRKELGLLQKKGWVITEKGKEGGSYLGKDSAKITLDKVYLLVKNSDVLGKKNLDTNPLCPVGKKINKKLNTLFSETDKLVIQSLKNKTLADFVHQFA